MNCPHCGREITRARKVSATAPPTDTTLLSEADARAYFKKTAPVEDTKFFLANGDRYLTDAERLELVKLIQNPPARAEHYRRLTAVQNAWRMRPHPETDRAFLAATKADEKRKAGKAYREAIARARKAIDDVAGTVDASGYYYNRNNQDREIRTTVRQLVRDARKLMPWHFSEEQAA